MPYPIVPNSFSLLKEQLPVIKSKPWEPTISMVLIINATKHWASLMALRACDKHMSSISYINCSECSSPMFDLGYESDEPCYYCEKCGTFQAKPFDAKAFEMCVSESHSL